MFEGSAAGALDNTRAEIRIFESSENRLLHRRRAANHLHVNRSSHKGCCEPKIQSQDVREPAITQSHGLPVAVAVARGSSERKRE